jgi:hypothetical protein
MQGKKAFWLVVVLLVVPAAGMTVFAWRMVGGVRANAARTDARMRELAWTVLAYADTFDAFPESEGELRGFAARAEGVPAALAKAPRDPAQRAYPMDRAAAGAPDHPASVEECLADIEVEWPIARDVQPILRSKGLPTLQGTAPAVGEWLFAMSERLRSQ